MEEEKEIEFNDPQDRKRRFLRGLNTLLGLDYSSLEQKDSPIREVISTPISELRKNLANTYCLEFTTQELAALIDTGITGRDFTEKYVPELYSDRGHVDLSKLQKQARVNDFVDLQKIEQAPKYGLNGNRWCDVTKGPCSCGAWH